MFLSLFTPNHGSFFKMRTSLVNVTIVERMWPLELMRTELNDANLPVCRNGMNWPISRRIRFRDLVRVLTKASEYLYSQLSD